MRAGETDGGVIRLDHSQSFGIGNHVNAPLLSGKQLRMIRLDRRRCDHKIALAGQFRSGLFVTDRDSFPRQHVRKLTGGGIRTAADRPALVEQTSQAAHAAAPDAYKMDRYTSETTFKAMF